jgi:hypothetical protein
LILTLREAPDDGIVVVMSEPTRSTRFETYEEAVAWLQASAAARTRAPGPPDENAPPEDEYSYWRMKESLARTDLIFATVRRENAQARVQRGTRRPGSERAAFLLREERVPADPLARIQQQLEDIKERMATRVELETLKDNVRLVAEGVNALTERMERVEARLARLEHRIERCELRLVALETTVAKHGDRLTALEQRQ